MSRASNRFWVVVKVFAVVALIMFLVGLTVFVRHDDKVAKSLLGKCLIAVAVAAVIIASVWGSLAFGEWRRKRRPRPEQIDNPDFVPPREDVSQILTVWEPWEGRYRGWHAAIQRPIPFGVAVAKALSEMDQPAKEPTLAYQLWIELSSDSPPLAIVSRKEAGLWQEWARQQCPGAARAIPIHDKDFDERFVVLGEDGARAESALSARARSALLTLPGACVYTGNRRLTFDLLVAPSCGDVPYLAAGLSWFVWHFAELRPEWVRDMDYMTGRMHSLAYRNLDLVFDVLIVLAEEMELLRGSTPRGHDVWR